MIRGKLTSTSQGTSNPITVTTPTSFQSNYLDSRINDPFSGGCEYLLLDGNGVDWEYGIGGQSGVGNFYRAWTPIETTNANATISLSASTPHTVYFFGPGVNHRCASMRYEKNITLTPGTNIISGWTGWDENVDNAWDIPGQVSEPLPTYYPYVTSYAKGFVKHLLVIQDNATTQAGFLYFRSRSYNLYLEPSISFVMPTADAMKMSGESPMCWYAPPFSTSYAGYNPYYQNEWEFLCENTGAGNIDVDIILTFDIYL